MLFIVSPHEKIAPVPVSNWVARSLPSTRFVAVLSFFICPFLPLSLTHTRTHTHTYTRGYTESVHVSRRDELYSGRYSRTSVSARDTDDTEKAERKPKRRNTRVHVLAMPCHATPRHTRRDATRFHGRHTTPFPTSSLSLSLSLSVSHRRTFNEPAGERNTRDCVPLPRNDICSRGIAGNAGHGLHNERPRRAPAA